MLNLTEGIGQARNHFLGKWDERRLCSQCGKRTNWIELTLQEHLHPGACTKAKWDELFDKDNTMADRCICGDWKDMHYKNGLCSACDCLKFEAIVDPKQLRRPN